MPWVRDKIIIDGIAIDMVLSIAEHLTHEIESLGLIASKESQEWTERAKFLCETYVEGMTTINLEMEKFVNEQFLKTLKP